MTKNVQVFVMLGFYLHSYQAHDTSVKFETFIGVRPPIGLSIICFRNVTHIIRELHIWISFIFTPSFSQSKDIKGTHELYKCIIKQFTF
jgi:hypothetical protein